MIKIRFFLQVFLSRTCGPCWTGASERVDSVQAVSQPAGVRLAVVHVHLALDSREPGQTQAPVHPIAAHCVCHTGSSVQAPAGAHGHLAARGGGMSRITIHWLRSYSNFSLAGAQRFIL